MCVECVVCVKSGAPLLLCCVCFLCGIDTRVLVSSSCVFYVHAVVEHAVCLGECESCVFVLSFAREAEREQRANSLVSRVHLVHIPLFTHVRRARCFFAPKQSIRAAATATTTKNKRATSLQAFLSRPTATPAATAPKKSGGDVSMPITNATRNKTTTTPTPIGGAGARNSCDNKGKILLRVDKRRFFLRVVCD